MLKYINGEVVILALNESTHTLLTLLFCLFGVVVFFFLIKRIVRNIYVGIFYNKKDFLLNVFFNKIHDLFKGRGIHFLAGFLLILFAWSFTTVLFNTLEVFLSHQSFDATTVEQINLISYTSLQERGVTHFIMTFMNYAGLILVFILMTTGLFIMIGSFVPFFQKIAYLLITFIIFFIFFMIFVGSYINVFEKIVTIKSATINI